MDHLLHDKAPISSAGWQAIDEEAKSRLTTYLAARKLVDFVGPDGWSHSATNLGRVTEDLEIPDRRASPPASAGCSPWSSCAPTSPSSRSEIDDIDRGAADADLADLDQATRRIALGENIVRLPRLQGGRHQGDHRDVVARADRLRR